MTRILGIETSTKLCSVALSVDGAMVDYLETSSDQFVHAEKLHAFIEELCKRQNLDMADLDAIAVGIGPGSYTGLRIGLSAAKGLAYALNLPLIAIDSIEILAQGFFAEGHSLKAGEALIPMLDARRLEVYCAIYRVEGRSTEVAAKILDEKGFEALEASKIYLLGDGAPKFKSVFAHPDSYHWIDLPYPSARYLAGLAFAKFQERQFADLAYLEPLYVKAFVAGKPKKLL